MKTLPILFLLFFTFTINAQTISRFYLGDWIQDCSIINDDDVVKNLALIDTSIIDIVSIAYEDEKCKTPYLIFKRGFQIQTLVVKPNAEQAVTVETTVKKVSYTSLSDEVTEALNRIAWCGSSAWETYQEKIVTGKSCGDYKAPTVGSSEKFVMSKSGGSLFINQDPTPYRKLIP